MAISKKRQKEISKDADIVKALYKEACKRWGVDAVQKDMTRIWDLRCMWGMQNILPFGRMVSRNLSEVLWVAENVCDLEK